MMFFSYLQNVNIVTLIRGRECAGVEREVSPGGSSFLPAREAPQNLWNPLWRFSEPVLEEVPGSRHIQYFLIIL